MHGQTHIKFPCVIEPQNYSPYTQKVPFIPCHGSSELSSHTHICILEYLLLIVSFLCEIPWAQLCIHLLISSCYAYMSSIHSIENFCVHHCIWKHLSLWSFPVRQEFWMKFFSYPGSWSTSQPVALSASRNDFPCNSVQFWLQYSFLGSGPLVH